MISDKLDSTHRYSSTYKALKAIKQDMRQECSGKFAGPMDVDKFLKEFVPVPSSSTVGPMPVTNWNDVLYTERENQMYQPFVRCLSVLVSTLHCDSNLLHILSVYLFCLAGGLSTPRSRG